MPRKAKTNSEQDVLVMRGIGTRIKSLREQFGLNPKEFGLLGGVSQAQQYRIEIGERVPDVIYVVKVAARLGISIDDLLILGQQAANLRNALPIGKGSVASESTLAPDEEILIDNYRHSPPEVQAALKAASSAGRNTGKKRGVA